MLQWPTRAKLALPHFFLPTQDIDIYVEDTGNEVFYTKFFRRILDGKVKVTKVFASGNRQSVIDDALARKGGSRSLYLIDGDLEWVVGTPAPQAQNLFRIDAYCFENLIIQESAIVRILTEECDLLPEDAAMRFAFSDWLSHISIPLTELFIYFAIARMCAPSLATVSKGVGHLCINGSGPQLCKAKTKKYKQELADKIAEIAPAPEIKQSESIIRSRVESLPNPHDIVSGKDFLLKLLQFELQRHGCRIRGEVLKNRLALNCDNERFLELQKAAISVAQGKSF